MPPKLYTTDEIARAVGVSRVTIQAWLKAGQVKPPRIQSRPGATPARLWTASDVTRLESVRKQMRKKVGRPPGKAKKAKV
jgi:DNA-binding transcriptional MerR regulator